MNPRYPNLFLIGAAKCGTSSMHMYLNDHPNIQMSKPKEPHYYATDLNGEYYLRDKLEYYSLFENHNEKTVFFGESSVYYLYSKEALKTIKKNHPDAKIIAMLRKPSEMLASLHSHLLYTGDENVNNFDQAWMLTDIRKAGKNIPPKCNEPKILYYDEIAKFGEQIDKLFSIFDKKQIKILLFEDFASNPKQTYDEVIDFLGLEKPDSTEFIIYNKNKQYRSELMDSIIMKISQVGASFAFKFKKIMGIKRLGIMSLLRKINTVEGKRNELSPKTRKIINDHYRSDIEKLSQLIDKDLTNWLK